MKKIFFALAAVAALAACSKSEIEYEQTGEIAFAPVSKNITKSMITGTEFPTTAGSFNVWAWYNQVDAGTTPDNWDTDNDNLYITKGEFIPSETTGLWKGNTSYYWPKVGSLLFAGYYHNTDADVSYKFDTSDNKMVFTGIKQREVNSASINTHTEDLMYFTMTSRSYNNGPVSVVFKHALSWVTVNLRHSGFTVKDGYPKITVHTVDFTNVNPEGTGTVIGTQENITWGLTGNVADTHITTSDVILDANNKTQKEMLFIPQLLTYDDPKTAEKEADYTMALKIKYTIYSSETEHFTETMHIPLKGIVGKTPSLTDPSASSTAIDSWEPAKHYTYNVVMGINEIYIQPTVTDWDTIEANLPI